MTTLQEQFEKDFPDKKVRKINAGFRYGRSKFTNYDLDLREYKDLEELILKRSKAIIKLPQNKVTVLNLGSSELTQIDLSQQGELRELESIDSRLTSVDFLNQLPNPEKLEVLHLFNNNIQPTDIEVFSRFVNLKELRIGTMKWLKEGKEGERNRFYGSFKSWKNLTKLEKICIEATDVNEGLEYLPMSLAKATREEKEQQFSRSLSIASSLIRDILKKASSGYCRIECSPHSTNVKCSQIKDQLRPFDYDLEAWQLAHPELMLKSHPEYFTNPDSKEQWINALTNKIIQTQQELTETKTNLPDKVKRIQRLESKLASLENIKNLLEELDIEKEHSKDINNWYQRQLGGENAQRRNELWNSILELKWNSKQENQEINQLKEEVETIKQLAEQRIQELENKISRLENRQEQQIETRVETTSRINTDN